MGLFLLAPVDNGLVEYIMNVPLEWLQVGCCLVNREHRVKEDSQAHSGLSPKTTPKVSAHLELLFSQHSPLHLV